MELFFYYMAQLSCHLSPSCETLRGHCGIVFFFEENHCEFLTDAMVKALLDRAATGYDVVDCFFNNFLEPFRHLP